MKLFYVMVIVFILALAGVFSVYVQIENVEDNSAGEFRLTDTLQKEATQKVQQEQGIQEKKLSTKTYYYGADLAATKQSNVVAYYHQDYLGSVRAQSDINKKKTSATRTAPFGAGVYESSNALASKNAYKFTSQEQDETLYYYGARYYDTKTGRFLSIDPIMSAESPYSYVSNNPLTFVDPSGTIQKVIHVGNMILPIREVKFRNMPEVAVAPLPDVTAVGNGLQKGYDPEYIQTIFSHEPESLMFNAEILNTIMKQTPKRLQESELSKVSGLVVVPREFQDPFKEWRPFLPVIDPPTLDAFASARIRIQREVGVVALIRSAYRTYEKQYGLKDENSNAASADTSPHRDPRAIDLSLIGIENGGFVSLENDANWIKVHTIMQEEGFLPWGNGKVPYEQIPKGDPETHKGDERNHFKFVGKGSSYSETIK